MRRLVAAGAELDDAALIDLYPWPTAGTWVRANMVGTVDGAVTGHDGRSRSISSEADRRLFLLLRRFADVVLVGAGTVRLEGYRPAPLAYADERIARSQAPAFVHAIVTRSGELDERMPLFVDAAQRPIVLTTAAARSSHLDDVADVIVCGDDEVDLSVAVAALAERGLRRIHCEGGPNLLGTMLAADLVDEVLLTLSPLAVGGVNDLGHSIGRIVDGPAIAAGQFTLAHALEDTESLFLRYLRQR